MEKRIQVAIFAALFLQPFLVAQAEPICQPRTYTDLVKCAVESSSDIKISEQQLKATTKLEDAADQWINPDLEADSLSKGSRNSETTASLLFTLRLGGKKTALINEARSEIQKAQATHDLYSGQSRLEIMLTLYRLSHLRSEIKLEEESGATFSKIVGQFQKRPALSPEQDVSLSVFRMALSDHQFRLVQLKSDEEKLLQALVAVTGIPKEVIVKNLPIKREQWPNVESNSEIESSPQIRQALADIKLAKSLKDKADSDAWPDIKIGPSIRTAKDNGESSTYVGVGLSMPLPLFTMNGGNRSYRAQKVAEAELVADQAKKKVNSSRKVLLNRYQQNVDSLKKSISVKALDEKHEQVERQFFKGLVPSSLVIEAHRQLFDLEQRRNSMELDTLETLGQLMILDNKFNGVIL